MRNIDAILEGKFKGIKPVELFGEWLEEEAEDETDHNE